MAISAADALRRAPPKLVESAIAFVWLGIAALTVVGAIVIAYVGSPDAPYWDHWGYTDPSVYLRDFFVRHNGHPMEVGRMLFAIDYQAFGAKGWWLQFVTFVNLGAGAAAFIQLAILGGVRGPLLVVFASLAVTLFFEGQGWECLRWPFQTPFVLAFIAPIVATYGLAAYVSRPKAWLLALSLTASALSLLSLSNGVFASVLLCGMAIYLRQPLRVVALYVLVAIFAIPVFMAPSNAPDPPFTSSLPLILEFVFHYLGGGVASTVGIFVPPPLSDLTIAWWLGLLLVLASVGLVARLILKNKRDPTATALAVLIIFAGATAALTALGRAFVGAEQALESRYAYGGAMLILAVVLLVGIEFRGSFAHRPLLSKSIVVFAAVIALVFPLSAGKLAHNLAGRVREETPAQTALVVGVRDEQSIGKLAYNLDMAMDASASLRAAHKWFFTDRWSRAIGQRQPISTVPACDGGEVLSVDGSGVGTGYLRVVGWVDRADARRGRIVVIMHDDEITGYGVVHKSPSDLTGGLFLNPSERTWSAHARVNLNAVAPSSNVYLASENTLICRIAQTGASSP